jgi:hypothetical protein
MPNDSLMDEIAPIRRAALDYIATNRLDPRKRRMLIQDLQNAEARLSSEIAERETSYLPELIAKEAAAINSRRAQIEKDPAYQRAFDAQRADHQQFEYLRRVNGGGFPRNISPVLYAIPLILVGIAEWYVNYATFAAIFIPVFAIAATLIVAAVFAGASHLHGAYLKQISEIIHPSVEYRNVLGRKLALIIATVSLIAAFVTVVWLRWLVISDQLGIGSGTAGGVFGGATTSMVWSRVGPTIIINLLIWGLGTLYSWTLHEKVPELREKYRDYLRASRSVERIQKPFFTEEKRLKAHFEREREQNKIAIDEHKTLLEDIRSTLSRVEATEAA